MNQVDDESKVYDEPVASSAVRMTSGAQGLGDSLLRKASVAKDSVKTKLSDAGINPDEIVSSAKGRANQLASSAKDQANDLKSILINEIKARPVQSIIAAALTGLVIGVLTSR